MKEHEIKKIIDDVKDNLSDEKPEMFISGYEAGLRRGLLEQRYADFASCADPNCESAAEGGKYCAAHSPYQKESSGKPLETLGGVRY